MKNLLIFLSIIAIICAVWYIVLAQKEKFSSSGRFHVRTSFKKIDEEHQGMANALKKFHELAVAHWKTEEKLFLEGKMRIPKDHPHNVDALWREHDQKHKEFIQRIVQMKKDIVAHIKDYDIPHFHFGPD